jgi:hypothetical protein
VSHIFISYVHQDRKPVEKLCDELRNFGTKTWIDSYDIPAGARWKLAIRKAIQEGDFFLACFSPAYLERSSTYMNEELTIAIETLRQKPTDRTWFIPVLLASCEVPAREIGAGETLHDLQFVHLYEDWKDGIRKILAVAMPVPPASDPDYDPGTPDIKIKAGLPVAMPVPPDYDSSTPAARIRAGLSAELLKPTISVLFVATNPQFSGRLRLDRELRDVQEQALDSRYRDRFDFRSAFAVRPRDLSLALLTAKPRFVHFAGHATKAETIVLEDEAGNPAPLSAHALSNLLRLGGDAVECVILNMCYSDGYAEEIAKHVAYVIGIKAEISDEQAIAFASAFYQALGAGESIPRSFQYALVSLELGGSSKEGPVLFSQGS